MGNIILVTSSKREIGQTAIGIKVGIEFSKKDKNVLLVDLSSGKRKISDYLNESENIIYDVKDVLDDTCSADQATINIKENLSIIPYPRLANKMGDIKKESFAKLIKEIKGEYDLIIIDIDSLALAYYIDFEDIYGLVTIENNDFSSISNINGDYEIAKKYRLEKRIGIINRYNKKAASKGVMLDIKEIKRMLSIENILSLEENNKYMDMDLEFLNSDEKNSFNNTVKELSKLL